MFDISEAGASAYDWNVGKIQGFDTTDPVEGGSTGVDNIPLTALAIRSRNIHDRLKTLEDMLITDSDTVINNLRDILDAFTGVTEQVGLIGLLARKACNVTDPADKASWVAAIEIAKRTYNLNSTEKASWVAGLDIEGIAQNKATAEVTAFHNLLLSNEFSNILNGFGIIFGNPSTTFAATFGGSLVNLSVDSPLWRQKLELDQGYITLGRCEVNWGDIGTGGSAWRTIGFNVGIFGIVAVGPGTWSTGAAGTVTVPGGHTLFEVVLNKSININKCIVFVSYSNTVVGNDHVILTSPSQPNNRVYILMREPSGGIRNEFGHIHILGAIDDYQ